VFRLSCRGWRWRECWRPRTWPRRRKRRQSPCCRSRATLLIKPDKTADFESVLAKYKESLEKSEKPARKQQLAGMKVFKSTQPAQGNAVYIIYVDPVVKDEEYDISRVIAEVFPTEVQEIFNKYKESFAGRAITALNKVP
jgi:hypothetical protein